MSSVIARLGAPGLAVLLAVAGGTAGFVLQRYIAQGPALPPAPIPAKVATPEFRPAFQMLDVDGRMRDISEWDGKVLVLNFWATWCGPCREEVPELVAFQRDFASAGAQVIGIALDEADKVRAFAAEFGMNYPLLAGGMDAIEIGRQYGNAAGVVPYSVVVDRDGRITYTKRGRIRRADLLAATGKLLKTAE